MDNYPNEFLTEDIAAIKQLIREGLDVNAKGDYLPTGGRETAFLHVAAAYDLSKVAKLLIEKGANINAQDSQGCTPLHRAIGHQSCKAAQTFIEAGANLDATTSIWPMDPPLHYALGHLSSLTDVRLNIVEMLVKSGANVAARDANGATPLHEAIFRSLQATRLLVEYGADVNAKDKRGNTPLCCIRDGGAVIGQKNGVEAARLLISHGADVHSKNADGETPLYLATIDGYTELMTFLIKQGADVNAQASDGWTPLWTCVIASGTRLDDEDEDPESYTKIAKLLVKAGANTKTQDKYGKTIFSEDGDVYYPDSPVMDYLFKVEMRRIVTQNI